MCTNKYMRINETYVDQFSLAECADFLQAELPLLAESKYFAEKLMCPDLEHGMLCSSARPYNKFAVKALVVFYRRIHLVRPGLTVWPLSGHRVVSRLVKMPGFYISIAFCLLQISEKCRAHIL